MNEIPPAPSPDQPRSIVFVAYPEMGLLDLTGAQTVFWAASKAMTIAAYQVTSAIRRASTAA